MPEGEKRERRFQPKIYTVDLSEGWDTASQLEILHDKIRSAPFYKEGLLYSGFDAEGIGETSTSRYQDLIFCGSEADLFSDNPLLDNDQNPFTYAQTYRHAAIAVYDPQKLVQASANNTGSSQSYRLKDDATPLAIIKLLF